MSKTQFAAQYYSQHYTFRPQYMDICRKLQDSSLIYTVHIVSSHLEMVKAYILVSIYKHCLHCNVTLQLDIMLKLY
jgi:hypothetical protein